MINVNDRFVWEHFDQDRDKWYGYGDNVWLKLETVYHLNAAVARMKIHGIEFEIRFNESPMNQCNLKTVKYHIFEDVMKIQVVILKNIQKWEWCHHLIILKLILLTSMWMCVVC